MSSRNWVRFSFIMVSIGLIEGDVELLIDELETYNHDLLKAIDNTVIELVEHKKFGNNGHKIVLKSEYDNTKYFHILYENEVWYLDYYNNV